MFNNPLNVLVSVAAMALTAIGAYNLFHGGYGEPLHVTAGTSAREVYNPGEPLKITYTYRRTRGDCKADLERYVMRADDGEIVWRSERVPANALEPDNKEHRLPSRIAVPPLPHGDYNVLTVLTSECNDGFHTARGPLVPFRVGVTNG